MNRPESRTMTGRTARRRQFNRLSEIAVHAAAALVLLLTVALLGYMLSGILPLLQSDTPEMQELQNPAETYADETTVRPAQHDPQQLVSRPFTNFRLQSDGVLEQRSMAGEVIHRYALPESLQQQQLHLLTVTGNDSAADNVTVYSREDSTMPSAAGTTGSVLLVAADGQIARLEHNPDSSPSADFIVQQVDLPDAHQIQMAVATRLPSAEIRLALLMSQAADNVQNIELQVYDWLDDGLRNIGTHGVESTEPTVPENTASLVSVGEQFSVLAFSGQRQILLATTGGQLHQFVLSQDSAELRLQHSQTSRQLVAMHALQALPPHGFLAITDDHRVHEYSWFDDPEATGWQPINQYQCSQSDSTVMLSAAEDSGWFACTDSSPRLALFYRGRQQPVWTSSAAPASETVSLAISAQGDLVWETNERVQRWQFDPTPPVDQYSLWQPIWYQGYPEPARLWAPDSSNQALAKFNVAPLLFGTMKAALLGLLCAVPLALLGAIYTAVIMPAYWRERCKPVVELMEAIPTVILGFLAAIWLAPLLQGHLFSFIFLILALPPVLVVIGYLWSSVVRPRVHGALRRLMPLLLLIAGLAVILVSGELIEWLVFENRFSAWLEVQFGWNFELRNALVVGLMLGLAVAPSIFALAEDALSDVPVQLRYASIALGASRWQTVWRVVVPGAASGLIAAVLIGFGRALGETMIVLMASSNSPIMEASLLRGLQSIAATLASDIPEAVPGSVHFQVLLYAAVVLFLFTFVINTLAELLRQRYRQRVY